MLDFGLAKVSQRQVPLAGSAAETLARVHTVPGEVMGTAHYMSPEQARGIAVDRGRISSVWAWLSTRWSRADGPSRARLPQTSSLLYLPPSRGLLPTTHQGHQASFNESLPRRCARTGTSAIRPPEDLWIDLKNLREEIAFSARLEKSGSPESRSPKADALPAQDHNRQSPTMNLRLRRCRPESQGSLPVLLPR